MRNMSKEIKGIREYDLIGLNVLCSIDIRDFDDEILVSYKGMVKQNSNNIIYVAKMLGEESLYVFIADREEVEKVELQEELEHEGEELGRKASEYFEEYFDCFDEKFEERFATFDAPVELWELFEMYEERAKINSGLMKMLGMDF